MKGGQQKPKQRCNCAIFPHRYKDECSQRTCSESEFNALKKVSKGLFELSSPGSGLWGACGDLFPKSGTHNKYKQELVLEFA